MKILTWNLERLTRNKNHLILEKLSELNADILILTETNATITPGSNYSFISTKPLPKNFDGVSYKEGENRTTIWTKYKMIDSYKTYDCYTSVCSEIETPFGPMLIYGTIIGVFGGKNERFKKDLQTQLIDFENLSNDKHVCIAGDFNVSFWGYAYPSHQARQILNDNFEKLELTNCTATIFDNVNHIVLNNHFKNKITEIQVWNIDKKLSDHFGVCLTICE